MKKLFLTVILAIITGFVMANPVKVGIITSDYTDHGELLVLEKLLMKDGAIVKYISMGELSAEKLTEYTVLYYHRSKIDPVSQLEVNAGDLIKSYVSVGGKLVLSMESVWLLNEWGVESQSLEAETRRLVDVGHGRAVGFRGYIEHPLYEDSNGGAYVWFSPEDNDVRTIGFAKDQLPKAEGAKIIGVEWVYIKYNEDRKLIWETPLGRGSILAIGGYLYYGQKNLNVKTLDIFTSNVLKYMTGTTTVKRALTWSYDTTRCVRSDYDLQLNASAIGDWSAPISELDATRESVKNFTWDLGGPQVLAMGTERAGIDEIWMHPVMSIRDYQVGVRLDGSNEVLWLKDLTPIVTNRPATFQRDYKFGNGATLTEMVVADTENPLMAVYYKTSGDIADLYVKYATNLRFMWPYSADCIGALNYTFSSDHSSLVVHDPTRTLNMMTNFSVAPDEVHNGLYSDFVVQSGEIRGVDTDQRKLGFIYKFNGNDVRNFRLLVSGGSEGLDKSVAYILDEQQTSAKIEQRSSGYYRDFAKEYMSITTDDPKFNVSYQWAMIALDQMYCNTPGIGKSLFAGFATTARGWNGWHKVSGRPGYAWYFGRDSEWMSMALTYFGNYSKVRDVLETLGRTQDPNGKVYHEYTTSGSVHYDAADATPLYVVLMNYYVRHTADVDFLRSQWSRVKRAMDFCYSTDTDDDGLIENTNVGHGWIEGGKLYGFHTTIYMAGLWAATLGDAAYLADIMGEDDLKMNYIKDQKRAREATNARFWNERTRFFNKGLWRDGSFSEEQAMLAAVPVLLGSIDQTKAEMCVDQLSSKYFSTDWGVRMLPYYSELYNPKSYHYGSVWPLFTGWTSLAEYKVGRNIQGFRHVMNNLLVHTTWDYGAAPEVLSGEKYAPAGVCMHQGWSSSMALLPLYEGMLGIRADALNARLSLSPALPMDWSYADIKNIPMAGSFVDMNYKRTERGYEFVLSRGKGESELKINLAPKLPLGTVVKRVLMNGKSIDFDIVHNRGDVQVRLPEFVIAVSDRVEILTTGGVAVLSNLTTLEVGDEDHGLKIPSESLNGKIYKLSLQGKKGQRYDVDIFCKAKIKSVIGGSIVSVSDKGIVTIRVDIPNNGNDNFVDHELVVELK